MVKSIAAAARSAKAGIGGVAVWMLVGVLVLALGLTWSRRHETGAKTPMAHVPLQTNQRPSATLPVLPLLDVSAADLPGASLEREAAAPTPVTELRREFETSSDLFAYAQRLAPQVHRGEADALWLLSKVVDYCSGYASDRTGFARDTEVMAGLRVPASMLQARARVAERCGRFSASDALVPAVIWQLRVKAAEKGSIAAEAALLAKGEPAISASGHGAELAERVLASRDPEAYTAMSAAVGNGTVQTAEVLAAKSTDGGGALADALRESSSTPQLDALAWQLAACRLGGQCGADSALMTSYCVNGGICSQRPDQDFETFVYDAAIPRQGAAVVRRMVDALVDDTGEPE